MCETGKIKRISGRIVVADDMLINLDII